MACAYPAICLSCGTLLGDKWKEYNRLIDEKTAKRLKKSNERPDAAMTSYNTSADNRDIFEELGIENLCCKICMTTAVSLDGAVR